ncbi:MAG: von Willebrand factor type A domain-containing protein, partial [Flavobacteriales bacterium]|nr:von Willebrand factor type A domain-containing protein [Flavobacteriales bacterium]
MKKMLPSIFAFFCLCLCTNAQESGIIKGKLTDKSTGEDIVFANVVLEQNGQMITGAAADINGCYEIKNIKAGSYDLRFKFIGYRDGFVSGINVVDDSTVVINHAFIQEVKLSCVEVTVQSSPKMTLGVVPGVMRSGRYKSPKISKRTLKNASRVENLRGSREHSNYYYIDGVKVRGGESLPKAKIEQVQTVLGGLPAQYENYGDIKGFESLPSVSGSYEIIELDGDNEGTIEKEPSELGTLAQQNEVDTETEEQYEPIEENEVIPTSEENTSTFSIDVDVASYANIRRFIKDQETPPPGSVRIEEMVNYFNYDYAQPEDTVPFAFHTEVAPSPWDVSKKIVHIGIKGGEIPKTKKLPNNLVFLVDVSGSMSSENKLPLVQKSLSLLVNQLGSDDQISLVVYAGSSGLVLPSTSCSNKSKIINAIRRLESGGSTAGGAGIELAYKVAQQNFKDDGNNRVILCTDGDFNVGV